MSQILEVGALRARGRRHALLAVLVAVPLAGCGGSSTPLTSVSAAVRVSLSHTFGARVTLIGAEALGAKPEGTLHAAGVFDVRRGLGYERVDVRGPLDRNKLPPRDFLIFQPTRILLSPAAQQALPPGKAVISVPLTEPAGPGADAFVQQAMGLNPLLLMDEISAGGIAAVKTGHEVVEHVPFVDYRVTVDLKRALTRVRGPFARGEREAIKRELAALGPRGPGVEIAVRTDGAGFVRDLHASVPGSKLGTLAFELHSYGLAYEPSYPRAAQLIKLASLAGAWSWSPHWPWLLGA